MNKLRQDLIAYRLERANALLQTSRNLADDQDWFSTVNRLYYAVYQAISALLVQAGIPVNSHAGARHSSDYGAFIEFSEEDVRPLLPETEAFIALLTQLIQTP